VAHDESRPVRLYLRHLSGLSAMRLTPAQRRVLLAMAGQSTLKAHRDIEGNKAYILHTLDGASEELPAALVQSLIELGLIDSNKKFPAATYWLTELGKRVTQNADLTGLGDL